MNKTLPLILLPILLLLTPVVTIAGDIKLGHIDLQRLISQSDAGKEAREKYLAKAKTYQDEINSRTERLKKLKEAIEQEGKTKGHNDKPSQSLQDKEKEYGTQTRELKRLLGGYQDELKVYDAELIRKVLEAFEPVVAAYARKEGYDYIFRGRDAMMFASDKRDLTEDLIKAFNITRKK